MGGSYCHVSPARVEITRALKVNPKTNMAAAKKIFQFGLYFSKLLVNGCFPGRGVITGLPFNRCCSLGFRKRLFCPVSEVYRASVTRFITMSPSHEANEESRHDQKVRPSPLVWLSFTGKALVYGWLVFYVQKRSSCSWKG